MNLLTTIESAFVSVVTKDEAWVATELAKGWQELKKLEAAGEKILETAAVDVLGVFSYIKDHQAGLLALLQKALEGVAAIGALEPHAAPLVAGATVAIDLATVALDKLSAGVTAGSTPISTLVNAYHVGNDAAVAVKTALKAISTQGAVIAPAAIAAPPAPAAA